MINTTPAKVLVADDEDATREFLKEFLNELGHQTIVVTNGREAIEKARLLEPDVILLDIMMPEVSGLEACQILKEDPLTKDIPIIFVTAKAGLNDQLKGLHLGATDYINKPYRITELAARLNAAVKLKKLQDQVKELNERLVDYQNLLTNPIKDSLTKSQTILTDLLAQREVTSKREVLVELHQNINLSLTRIDHLLGINNTPNLE